MRVGIWRSRVQWWVALAVAVVAVFGLATAVSAGWTTIVMPDGAIDANWGAPIFTEACDPAINDRDDVQKAWFAYDGNSVYFRFQTCDAASIPLSDANKRAAAAIDCNNDGSFNGVEDFVVLVDNTAAVALRKGNSPYPQVGSYAYADLVPGEVEWKINLVNLRDSSGRTCRISAGPARVRLTTLTIQGYTFTTIDEVGILSHHNPLDMGDAPDAPLDANGTCASPSLGTRFGCGSNGGARHGLGSSARLGTAIVDPEEGTAENATATADDIAGSTPDDEDDGVQPSMEAVWAEGSTPELNYVVSGIVASPDYISCWIDWNGNNAWDADDRILNDGEAIAGPDGSGSGTLGAAVAVPDVFDGVNPKTLTARCRLAPEQNQANIPTGPVEFGEVEDYRWAFGANGNRPFNLDSVTIALNETGDGTIVSWTDDAANESYRLLGHSTDPYFPTAAGSQIGDIVTSELWQQSHAGPFADGMHYYMVLGRVTVEGGAILESAKSNRVGVFQFALQPGTAE